MLRIKIRGNYYYNSNKTKFMSDLNKDITNISKDIFLTIVETVSIKIKKTI